MAASRMPEPVDNFDTFAETVTDRLGQALVAANGVEFGNDLLGEVLAYAWEHWAELQGMRNPLGYLYRVSQSRARRYRRWHRGVELIGEPHASAVAPCERDFVELVALLERLTRSQRMAVLLVHGYDWSYAEVAELLGVSVAAVTNHVHRGMKRLRAQLLSSEGLE